MHYQRGWQWEISEYLGVIVNPTLIPHYNTSRSGPNLIKPRSLLDPSSVLYTAHPSNDNRYLWLSTQPYSTKHHMELLTHYGLQWDQWCPSLLNTISTERDVSPWVLSFGEIHYLSLQTQIEVFFPSNQIYEGSGRDRLSLLTVILNPTKWLERRWEQDFNPSPTNS